MEQQRAEIANIALSFSYCPNGELANFSENLSPALLKRTRQLYRQMSRIYVPVILIDKEGENILHGLTPQNTADIPYRS